MRFAQQGKTSSFTFFQWNEFRPSAGLTAGLESVQVSTALTAGKCLPLRLCKGTVKESSSIGYWTTHSCQTCHYCHITNINITLQFIIHEPSMPHSNKNWTLACVVTHRSTWKNYWSSQMSDVNGTILYIEYNIFIQCLVVMALNSQNSRLWWSSWLLFGTLSL